MLGSGAEIAATVNLPLRFDSAETRAEVQA
jgi:hypothetical protein